MQPHFITRQVVRTVTSTLCLGLGLLLTGCAASEKASFTDHLSATVAPGAGDSDDVIMAFSLDQPQLPSAVVRQSGD